MEHTPTPWHNHDMEATAICGPDHNVTASCDARSRKDSENEANAAFICKAVNSHDELVEAARRAEVKLTAYVGVCTGDKELTDAILPMLRAALAKAQAA